MIAGKLNVNPPKKEAAKWMTEVAWRWDWIITNFFFQDRKLTKAIAKSLHASDIYSSKKIKTELNYRFTAMEKVIESIAKQF